MPALRTTPATIAPANLPLPRYIPTIPLLRRLYYYYYYYDSPSPSPSSSSARSRPYSTLPLNRQLPLRFPLFFSPTLLAPPLPPLHDHEG